MEDLGLKHELEYLGLSEVPNKAVASKSDSMPILSSILSYGFKDNTKPSPQMREPLEQSASVNPTEANCIPVMNEVPPPRVSQQVPGQRRHICEHCGRSFAQKCRLRSHVEVIHFKQRPYIC
ncbi:unnamed protein product [Dicrocoelium dendriticum]|nr:unnamed protein product [Dicrocoelium dendriticum]